MAKTLPNHNPLHLKSWKALQKHQQELAQTTIADHFLQEPDRIEYSVLEWEDFYVDVSKNRINKRTLELLLQLANESGLEQAIQAQFKGVAINETENRAVLHTALRQVDSQPVLVSGKNILPEIASTKEKMYQFCEQIISGQWKGYTGKAITHVVNIGIGGSDLGPAMVYEALAFYKNHLDVRFVSNVDGDHYREKIKDLNPETTLFVVVSKTFTTQETLSNTNSIRAWFLEQAPESAVKNHFAAVSTNLEKTTAFGIAAENIFPMNDWVGGRFSLWSTVGLSIALAVGPKHFEALLNGAGQMDVHFKTSTFDKNIPVVLALISIWYNNFWGGRNRSFSALYGISETTPCLFATRNHGK